ncbi:hypothetical protein [Roseibium polysiphoniae]|uniref:hypothetical protein n=1 Tax=Roseibium polysiphoniae TaxID=2571221 RepID=UPI001BCFE866|nr:hypothetical protein [Roseibium polysiphoniae]
MTDTAPHRSPHSENWNRHEASADPLGPLLETARSEALGLAQTLKRESLRFVEGQQDRSSAILDEIAHTLREREAGKNDAPAALSVTAADYISASAHKIREADAAASIETLGATARKHPVPLAIGAAAIGFLAARFISSTDQ